MKKIILASSSKHRKKLLNQLKIKFTTKSPNIDESRRKNENVDEFVRRLSYEKALKVAKDERDSIVIGSDEIAVLGNKVYGKPLTKSVAIQQLQAISNKNIVFKTGLCVIDTSAHKKYLSLTNYNVKMRSVEKFINEGDKVKVTLRFRGREMAHQDRGEVLLEKIKIETDEFAKVELLPKFEGRQMIMIIQPN